VTPPGRRARVLRGGVSVAVAAVLFVVVLPRVTGAHWAVVGTRLGQLGAGEILLLTAVWCAGLACYATVLVASVPGLRHAQAVTVNVTGSAVSNLLPLGGAAGLATTFAMLGSWGFPPATVALSALVTGVWNVFAKLVLPLVALAGLLLAGDVATGRLAVGAAVGVAVLAVALAVLAGTLTSERVARGVGRVLQAVGHAVLRLARSPRRLDWAHAVPARRHLVIDLVRVAWLRMTVGLIGFLGSQALLLYLSLHALGGSLGPAQVFAGYAFGRLLTTLPVTPGGVGVTETGVAGLLVALGSDGDTATSAVLLFSGFAFFAEFPAGAAGYVVWATRRSWRRPLAPPFPPAGLSPAGPR